MTTQIENEHLRNGIVPVKNGKLTCLKVDHLYHIALDTDQHDLHRMFGDVKFVCFGGQVSRMERFTAFLNKELGIEPHEGDSPTNYAAGTDRYALYKAGPVLAVSHGIGVPSLSVVFNEIIKLLHYAKCSDVTFFRIGTCGGVGVALPTSDYTGINSSTPEEFVSLIEDWSPVEYKTYDGDQFTKRAMHLCFRDSSNNTSLQAILGKKIQRPATVRRELLDELMGCSQATDNFKTVLGTTMCTDDFYEGQARLDGAFCDYDEDDKMKFLHNLKDHGVCNIEMESLGFLALCNHAGVPGAVACVTLLDRLKGDFVSTDFDLLKSWQQRAQLIVLRFIKRRLAQQNGN